MAQIILPATTHYNNRGSHMFRQFIVRSAHRVGQWGYTGLQAGIAFRQTILALERRLTV